MPVDDVTTSSIENASRCLFGTIRTRLCQAQRHTCRGHALSFPLSGSDQPISDLTCFFSIGEAIREDGLRLGLARAWPCRLVRHYKVCILDRQRSLPFSQLGWTIASTDVKMRLGTTRPFIRRHLDNSCRCITVISSTTSHDVRKAGYEAG